MTKNYKNERRKNSFEDVKSFIIKSNNNNEDYLKIFNDFDKDEEIETNYYSNEEEFQNFLNDF